MKNFGGENQREIKLLIWDKFKRKGEIKNWK